MADEDCEKACKRHCGRGMVATPVFSNNVMLQIPKFKSSNAEDSATIISTSPISEASNNNLELTVDSQTRHYSSTSTVFASFFITSKNTEEICTCIGYVIIAHINENSQLSLENQLQFSDLNISPGLPPMPSAAAGNMGNENDDASCLYENEPPCVYSIFKYVSYIYSRTSYSPECNILALIYFNRLTTYSKLRITGQNYQAIWLICVILAQKVSEDNSVKTSAFAVLFPNYTRKVLKKLEVRILMILRYSMGVKSSLFAKYYFQLRDLYITTFDNNGRDWEQLTNSEAGNRLELRTFYKQRECLGYLQGKVNKKISKDDSSVGQYNNKSKFMIRQCA